MNRDTFRQIVNVIGVIIVLVVNTLAVTLPLNGQDTGAISDRFQVYFVPAGYVFSIWGLIYIGLIAFGVYQALPAQRDNPRLRKVGYLFFLSCLANATWLFLWHYLLFIWTVFVMLILLGLLIAIYLRLGIGRERVSLVERLTTQLTFSVYLGWISVATIANITQVLWYLGWNGEPLTAALWAVIMLAAGVVIAFIMTISRGDWAFILVLIWAYIGIAVKQAETVFVANAAWAAVIALAVLAGAAALRIPRRNVG
jgi:hypothetical protein